MNRWTALAAPLEVPTDDGRVFDQSPSYGVRPEGAPLRWGLGGPVIGTVDGITVTDEAIMLHGTVDDTAAADLFSGTVHPEVDMYADGDVFYTPPGDEPELLHIRGGTVTGLVAGTNPAWQPPRLWFAPDPPGRPE